MRSIILAIAAACTSPAFAQVPVRDAAEKSCSGDAVHLLIVGSYHMDNPGLDAVNVVADDVLAPRRQSEIAALNDSLLEFRPTKVAVEGDRSKTIWKDRYKQWIAGTCRENIGSWRSRAVDRWFGPSGDPQGVCDRIAHILPHRHALLSRRLRQFVA